MIALTNKLKFHYNECYSRSVMGRSPCCDESGVKKGPWTPEERSDSGGLHTSTWAWKLEGAPEACRVEQVWKELPAPVDKLSEAQYQEEEIHRSRRGNNHLPSFCARK